MRNKISVNNVGGGSSQGDEKADAEVDRLEREIAIHIRRYSFKECMAMLAFSKSERTFNRRVNVVVAEFKRPVPVDRSFTLKELSQFQRNWGLLERRRIELRKQKYQRQIELKRRLAVEHLDDAEKSALNKPPKE